VKESLKLIIQFMLKLIDMEFKFVFFIVGLLVIFVVGEVGSGTRTTINVEQQHIAKLELCNNEGIRGGKGVGKGFGGGIRRKWRRSLCFVTNTWISTPQ